PLAAPCRRHPGFAARRGTGEWRNCFGVHAQWRCWLLLRRMAAGRRIRILAPLFPLVVRTGLPARCGSASALTRRDRAGAAPWAFGAPDRLSPRIAIELPRPVAGGIL